LEHFNITQEIEVIPNFVDLNRFDHRAKDHFRKAIAPHNEKLIIHTSNFRKVKRVQDVVQVFFEVNKVIPSKLLLVGDGPERSSVEQQCRDLNIMEHVRFLGKQDAVEEILSISDLFIMPSETESFGLAALEAMACCVPVVSTNAGGIPELNINGKTGFMSEVGDVADMAKNAIYILEDDNRLNKFKSAAQARAREFDISKIMPMYVKLYEKVLGKR
jgi:N-acetyl-alpha-D-glucosaminyl L-malate synthase BshA